MQSQKSGTDADIHGQVHATAVNNAPVAKLIKETADVTGNFPVPLVPFLELWQHKTHKRQTMAA